MQKQLNYDGPQAKELWQRKVVPLYSLALPTRKTEEAQKGEIVRARS